MTMTSTIRIGIARIASNVENFDANFNIRREWIGRGHEADRDMLVFPEGSLAGHPGARRELYAALRSDDPRSFNGAVSDQVETNTSEKIHRLSTV